MRLLHIELDTSDLHYGAHKQDEFGLLAGRLARVSIKDSLEAEG